MSWVFSIKIQRVTQAWSFYFSQEYKMVRRNIRRDGHHLAYDHLTITRFFLNHMLLISAALLHHRQANLARVSRGAVIWAETRLISQQSVPNNISHLWISWMYYHSAASPSSGDAEPAEDECGTAHEDQCSYSAVPFCSCEKYTRTIYVWHFVCILWRKTWRYVIYRIPWITKIWPVYILKPTSHSSYKNTKLRQNKKKAIRISPISISRAGQSPTEERTLNWLSKKPKLVSNNQQTIQEKRKE